MSEKKENCLEAETEELPSDFFDDFNKEEFIEGLSVIDSWNDEDGSQSKNPKIDKNELVEEKDMQSNDNNVHKQNEVIQSKEKDDYFRPGCRRDPNKTNEAIRKDKQDKVKEHLAKSLDNVKPPGTELDDFCEDSTMLHKTKSSKLNQDIKQFENVKKPYKFEDARRMDVKNYEESRRYNDSKKSDIRKYEDRRFQHSQRHFSPPRRSPRRRFSPVRRYSPHRHSPYHRSPRRHRSRSPEHRRLQDPHWRSPVRRPSPENRRIREPQHVSDKSENIPRPIPAPAAAPAPRNTVFPMASTSSTPTWEPNPVKFTAYEYSAPAQPAPVLPMTYPRVYDYNAPGISPAALPYTMAPGDGFPQAVPAPTTISMVSPPKLSPPVNFSVSTLSNKSSYTLAQLVADGKISKEDYLKLAPNKGVKPNPNAMDLKDKVDLLQRCQGAISKLAKNRLPNRLVVLHKLPNQEQKSIASVFCSPLKRQPMVEFQFTQLSPASVAQHNKLLIDNIAVAIGFEQLLSKVPKKEKKDTKDASVQTIRPYCDICEIRDLTKHYEIGTSTNHEYFTASAYTQVVDKDLVNSKSVFAPSGGITEGASMSIAHMTPAQLVTQLAAKAKTLKQAEPSPEMSYSNFERRNPSSYDYNYNRGGNQYNNRGYRY